ncbi:hypothetical protein P7K49_029802 [Saguinus oedipus]|uniref:Uncharacterized protein n=1 Tax=Saguinus oedipus TaxID=9490 RepID=A0ABQ9U899_SAGOE|nr:hypothetical protein P7K49_029802 [Saguinus oedipus]
MPAGYAASTFPNGSQPGSCHANKAFKYPSYLLLHPVCYAADTLSFIKLAALQQMQLKINKLEDPTSLENSSPLSMEF